MPNSENEANMALSQWPGLNAHMSNARGWDAMFTEMVDKANAGLPEQAYYTEKLFVGYRFYEAQGINFTTGFPFGHGMSYTTFRYTGLVISGATVAFTVVNDGKIPGAEVAQVYLRFPKSAGEPPLQLKGFWKTRVLSPGDSEDVRIQLTPRDLSVWDAVAHTWAPVIGVFDVKVGSSSRDIRLEGVLPATANQSLGKSLIIAGAVSFCLLLACWHGPCGHSSIRKSTSLLKQDPHGQSNFWKLDASPATTRSTSVSDAVNSPNSYHAAAILPA